MKKYDWISHQSLHTLTTPFPHGSRQELEEALESYVMELLDGSPIIDLLMTKVDEMDYGMNREDRREARFQIECKFRAWGYDSSEEMMENEPELAADTDPEFSYDEEKQWDLAMEIAMKYVRALVDLQHHLIKDKSATFFSDHGLDNVKRKVLLDLVEANNEHCDPMLPKLKAAVTVGKKSAKGQVEISLL